MKTRSIRGALLGALVAVGCAQSGGGLVATATEPAGMNCPAGGQRVTAGVDLDNDGTLAAAEVKSTVYVCNGATGQAGAAGAEGLAALVAVTAEAAGMNCPNGGNAITAGLDDNRNGALEPGEVDSTRYVCNGTNGGFNALTRVTTEPAGANCTFGGQKLEAGVDTSANGMLEAGEVTSTSYVCNGATAFALLSQASAEPAGTNCATGGVRVVSGLDDGDGGGTARDGMLSTGEVDSTSYVCNGGAGATTLVTVTAEPVGTNCVTGGQRLTVGLDNGDGGGTANNGTLEAGEVDGTSYVCTGAPGMTGPAGDAGTPGAAGFASLVSITPEPAGANCATPGQRITQGLDNGDGGGIARNGTLEAGEVDSTRYLCEATPTVAEVCRVPSYRFGTTVEVIHSGPDKTTEALVLVRLDTRALITATPARMQTSCADLRVVDQAGTALRHHVVLGTCNTTNTQVLVRLPAGVRFGSQRIVVQYGNATAATASESIAAFFGAATFTETFETGFSPWTSATFNGPDFSESSSTALDPSVPMGGGTQSLRLRTDANCSGNFNGMGLGATRTVSLPLGTHLVVADQRSQITGFEFFTGGTQISAIAVNSSSGPATGLEVTRLDTSCSGSSCTAAGTWTRVAGVAVGVPLNNLVLRTLSTDCIDGNAYFDNITVYSLPDDGDTFSRSNGFQQACP
ncbi:MAG: DUF2341 domain-containing protein [Myxococcaceae bacterium]|nr:DUF2341 domain-containing protein [Myxococcaceae bacterium]